MFPDCLRGNRDVACWILQISWQLIKQFIFKFKFLKTNLQFGAWLSDRDNNLKKNKKAVCADYCFKDTGRRRWCCSAVLEKKVQKDCLFLWEWIYFESREDLTFVSATCFQHFCHNTDTTCLPSSTPWLLSNSLWCALRVQTAPLLWQERLQQCLKSVSGTAMYTMGPERHLRGLSFSPSLPPTPGKQLSSEREEQFQLLHTEVVYTDEWLLVLSEMKIIYCKITAWNSTIWGFVYVFI